MRSIAAVVLMISLLCAYTTQSVVAQAATPAPTPEATACPTQSAPIDVAEMYKLIPANTFDPTLWSEAGSWDKDRTTVTWRGLTQDAVAYLEYVHFDCGLTLAGMNQYFSPDSFKVIFSTYTSFNEAAVCHKDNVTLFEFDLVGKTNYHALLWVEPVTPTRLADLTLTFESTAQQQAAAYAAHLFPAIPNCKAVTG